MKTETRMVIFFAQSSGTLEDGAKRSFDDYCADGWRALHFQQDARGDRFLVVMQREKKFEGEIAGGYVPST